MTINRPWLRHYGDVPAHLSYPDCSMVDLIERAALKTPDLIAYDFMGTRVSYRDFIQQIHACARSLCAIGIQPGDRVTICMPNTPQAVVLFYALNRMGALANMVHPLSSEEEILFFLQLSQSKAALTLDQFYPKFSKISDRYPLKTLMITSIKDALPPIKKIGYALTKGRKIPVVPADPAVLDWKDFLARGATYAAAYLAHPRGGDTAAILYSGGTTGTTKGILLSNLNFNALALQTGAAGNCLFPGHSMLAIMPVFHGFGLGVCIHTALVHSAKCILIPQFNADTYVALLKKHRPNYIAGVPTLFEALLRNPGMNTVDFSQLEGIFSGGDSLSIELKRKVDSFLTAHGSKEQIREGYGTTECVTASCLTPRHFHKEGSIGIPFPDTDFKIVAPATQDELPYGEIGEICISSPTVMQGYLNQPKETSHTLQLHEDGALWLHTGDLGSMDEDGFVYFKQRLKRMIISSGYNIYPSQLENAIDSHPDVLMSTVIGVKDDLKMQKAKAFVVLRPGLSATPERKAEILAFCEKRIAKYAMPYEFEYRDSLPKTLVGKIAYTVLEQQEATKNPE